MKHAIFLAKDTGKRTYLQPLCKLLLGTILFAGLAGCGEKYEEAPFNEGAKGYVEFYMPVAKPGEEDLGVDTTIYQIENGRRVFKGMTNKWKGLSEAKRGLTVVTAPGEQSFVIAYDKTEVPVKLQVGQGAYRKVRIEMTGLRADQMLGTMRQYSFGLKATVELSP